MNQIGTACHVINQVVNQDTVVSKIRIDLSPKKVLSANPHAIKQHIHISKNDQGLFGEELVVGMKFADWLTLRLNVIDDNDALGLFSSFGSSQLYQADSDLSGYSS